MSISTPAEPLSPKDLKTVVRGLAAICEARPVRLCYLYGSYATGTPTVLSDIDVGFLLHVEERRTRWKMYSDLSAEIAAICPGLEIDVVLLNDVGPILRNKIIRTGRLVFEMDDSARAAFECRTLKEYFDFRYYADMYDRSLFQSIKEGESFGPGSRNRGNTVEQVAGFRSSPD